LLPARRKTAGSLAFRIVISTNQFKNGRPYTSGWRSSQRPLPVLNELIAPTDALAVPYLSPRR
jgi:hypothetical protein